MGKVNLVVLTNDIKGDHSLWLESVNKYPDLFNVRIVDLLAPNWLQEILSEKIDFILVKPPSLLSRVKTVYDERLSLIDKYLGITLIPTLEEILIYENKRHLSDWMRVNEIPHPETFVFYSKDQALSFGTSVQYPLVAKTNIGASGSGVIILQNFEALKKYTLKTFEGKGAPRRIYPKLNSKNFTSKLKRLFNEPDLLGKKVELLKSSRTEIQNYFVIFQRYVPHEYEWRVVCIGDYYFAHKKIKSGDKASGTLIKEYCAPPYKLLDFCEAIMKKHSFFSQAIDIFESDGTYLVNEMQCMFGQSDPHQMIIDGNPGRFIKRGTEWVFEVGNFNGNQSFDTRIDVLVEIIAKKNLK